MPAVECLRCGEVKCTEDSVTATDEERGILIDWAARHKMEMHPDNGLPDFVRKARMFNHHFITPMHLRFRDDLRIKKE